MLPSRLVVGWCFGVLVIEGAAASSWETSPPKPVGAKPLLVQSLALSTASPDKLTSLPNRMAQNASDRRNLAGVVSLQMSPDQSVGVGSKISFRIAAKKPGYLMLVDIDPDGKMSQIFPTPEMIVQSQEAAANFVQPGKELLIPNSAAKKRGFEYVITPPVGEAAMVAILSERRVQILDLPDTAPKQRSEAETVGYLIEWTSALRIPDRGTGKLQPGDWWFDFKRYTIK